MTGRFLLLEFILKTIAILYLNQYLKPPSVDP